MESSRLNLKLPNNIIAYLKEMGWRERTSLTQYLIKLVKNDMETHISVCNEIFDRR